MSYINDKLRDNGRNNYQASYLRNNSEKNFLKRNIVNYDKIYNKFLTSPYPPMYYQRSTIDSDNYYNNNYKEFKESPVFINDNNNDKYNNNSNNYNNNYQYRQVQTTNDLNALDGERNIIRNNSFNKEYKNKLNENNYVNNNDDSFYENEMRRKQYAERNGNEKMNNDNINYHYNNELTEDKNIIYNYNAKKPYESNEEKENFNKRYNDKRNFNMMDMDNNNLYKSYDNTNERKRNPGYISPIITKIAKKNFLLENPYTDKEQSLGPSMLRNNPILYPIDTYKFDFNRYIKGDFVNKFV